jgi:hypothetical protein
MSAIWTENNRDWDLVSDMNMPAEMQGAPPPIRRYLGCLTGSAAGDTVWVRHFVPATGLKQGQLAVTGDCSSVAGLVGTWHTHPYRAGFRHRAIKERGLSGLDLKIFGAAGDLVTIVVWDTDSLDIAIKGLDGVVRYPASYVIR